MNDLLNWISDTKPDDLCLAVVHFEKVSVSQLRVGLYSAQGRYELFQNNDDVEKGVLNCYR